MIRTKEGYKLRRACVNLREGDWEWLQGMFGGSIGAGRAVRELVIKCRKHAEAKAEQRLETTHNLDLNFEDIMS